MVHIQRVLCPTDFSDISRHALEHAIVVARWYESTITALHVGSPMIALGSVAPLPPPVAGRTLTGASTLQSLEEQARAWVSPADTAGLRTEVVIDEGDVAGSILEHARALPADLIVIGTHGQGGFERLVLGSIAEKVLRKAACPVLTVPPRAVGTSTLPFAHLLCAVDFSDSSIEALRFALSVAQESNARLTLLHVFEWPPDEPSASRFSDASESRREWEAETRQRLDALIPDDVRNWCAVEGALVHGKAHEAIVSYAAAGRADLIVMGVRGRNPVDLILFGSTTNQVVRRATCPVLTLRR